MLRVRVGPEHGAPVGAPGQAIADGHALEFLDQSAGGKTLHGADGGDARLADRADPEAALGIALAVVEALLRGVVRRGGELLARGGGRIETPDAAAQRQQQTAVGQRRHGGRLGVEIPGLARTASWIEAMQLHSRNVAVIQHLLGGVPHRRFTQDAGLGHRDAQAGLGVMACASWPAVTARSRRAASRPRSIHRARRGAVHAPAGRPCGWRWRHG